MIRGIEQLRLARSVLQRATEESSPTALLAASSEIWSAMFDLHTWPTELRAKGVELQGILFRYGPIRMTLEQMVEPERLQLRRELLCFLDLADRIENCDRAADQQPSP